ncbi:hypothetical protein DESC_590055 [Desulfosarcina cetonica]|nr:hypothetical protein DESC_590055 [Desulfosarcina cetonica]
MALIDSKYWVLITPTTRMKSKCICPAREGPGWNPLDLIAANIILTGIKPARATKVRQNRTIYSV